MRAAIVLKPCRGGVVAAEAATTGPAPTHLAWCDRAFIPGGRC